MTDETRSGAALIFVIAACATLVALAAGASALLSSRHRAERAVCFRAKAGVLARKALERAINSIDADTNGVDSATESWGVSTEEARLGLARGENGVFTLIEDESARIGVPSAGENAFAWLLRHAAEADEAEASGIASALFSTLGTNSALVAEAELPELFESPPEALLAVLPLISVNAPEEFNINTIGREAFLSRARASGATAGAAAGLWHRLEMSRKRGEIFLSPSPAEARKLLQGEGDVPSQDELNALTLLQPHIAVESGLFRITVIVRENGCESSLSCTYRRNEKVLNCICNWK